MAEDMKGKVALVTGAGEGIGRGTALAFAREGVAVAVVDIDAALGEATVRMIKETGGEAVYVQCDVTQSADVQAMVKQVMDKFGRIDILVNNAGILGPYFLVDEYPEEMWDQVIAVNLKGTFLCCKAVLPIMKKQGNGSIINIASVAGKEGNAQMAPYSASKGGIITLTKTLGKELAASKIRVNCVSPALLETDMAKAMTPEQRALLTTKIPMGRLGKPEEVAAVVKFLASDESSFVTGQCYDISGGRSVY